MMEHRFFNFNVLCVCVCLCVFVCVCVGGGYFCFWLAATTKLLSLSPLAKSDENVAIKIIHSLVAVAEKWQDWAGKDEIITVKGYLNLVDCPAISTLATTFMIFSLLSYTQNPSGIKGYTVKFLY